MDHHSDKTYSSDEQLLQRYCSSGNCEVLGELYARYMELVYGVALRYLRQRDQAEHVVIEIFEELRRLLPSQRVECFRTWLHALVCERCREYLVIQVRTSMLPPSIEFEEQQELIDELCGEAKESPALTAACEKLTDKERQCIDMFFSRGYSYADIATTNSWQSKSVKRYIQNGMRTLRLCLEDREK